MTEPDVALTNYGLVVECAIFIWLIGRCANSRLGLRGWMASLFGPTAAAALFGGTLHGDGHGWTQDRVHLPSIRDRRRHLPAGGGRKTEPIWSWGRCRGPGTLQPGHRQNELRDPPWTISDRDLVRARVAATWDGVMTLARSGPHIGAPLVILKGNAWA